MNSATAKTITVMALMGLFTRPQSELRRGVIAEAISFPNTDSSRSGRARPPAHSPVL